MMKRCLLALFLLLVTCGAARATGSVQIAWTDNAANESGYRVYRATGTASLALFTTLAANVVTYVDTTIDVGTRYTYEVRAFNSVGESTGSNDVIITGVGIPGTGTTNALITQPTAGATVTGTQALLADLNVAGIQFKIDGANFGSEDTSSPFTVNWDTTLSTNAAHAVSGVVRDTNGTLTTLASVSVNVNNVAPGAPVKKLDYDFDENTGTVIHDTSGNGYTGHTAGTMWWTTGQYGSALYFGGTNARVVSTFATHAALRSYCLWTYRTGAGANNQGTLFDKRTGSAQVETLYNDESSLTYRYTRVWSTGTGTWTIVQPSANAWHHVCVTYDGTSTANAPLFYLDGVSQTVAQTSVPAGALNSNADPYIIGNRGAGDRGWKGVLDNVRIYDGILTLSAVNTDKNAP